MSVYDFVVKANNGEEKSLAAYKGKVLLIVNTASKCGFTPQFKELQELYVKYKAQGLVFLGFPCNQFAGQEPGTNEEVQEFCRFNYGVTFPIFAKGDVRGENAQPLFQYLTKEQGFKGFDADHPYAELLSNAFKENFPEYLEGDSIKWNFTKFLVDRNGQVISRFEPTASMDRVAACVQDCLK